MISYNFRTSWNPMNHFDIFAARNSTCVYLIQLFSSRHVILFRIVCILTWISLSVYIIKTSNLKTLRIQRKSIFETPEKLCKSSSVCNFFSWLRSDGFSVAELLLGEATTYVLIFFEIVHRTQSKDKLNLLRQKCHQY